HAATYSKVVFNETDGVYDVYVTALNILNKNSLVAFCSALPIHTQEIFVGAGFLTEDSVRVHFLGVKEDAE
ncbi:MAG: hypothetical protein AAF203_04610, partial [Pseudomonadota bacterium]